MSRTATGIERVRCALGHGLPRQVIQMQQEHNRLVSGILEILQVDMRSGIADVLDWWEWLAENPVERPKWKERV
jgi:hypothetical protein